MRSLRSRVIPGRPGKYPMPNATNTEAARPVQTSQPRQRRDTVVVARVWATQSIATASKSNANMT